jgi:hypothetical protein
MTAPAQKGGLEELVPLAEVVPLVGQILGAAARFALRQEELAEIHSCLTRALATTDASSGIPGRWQRVRHPRERRAWHAAQRQAAEEILACGGVLLDDPASQASQPSPARPAKSTAVALTGSSRQVLEQVIGMAREELNSALAEDSFTPWSVRSSAALTLNAKARWRARIAESAKPNDDLELRQLASLIANTKDAKVSDVDDDAFDAFGMRIGRRFAANLEASEALRFLVARLDREDRQKAEAAMVKAAQGLRVAILMMVIVLGVAAAALVEMAVRQTI